jgi:hypothetical protein
MRSPNLYIFTASQLSMCANGALLRCVNLLWLDVMHPTIDLLPSALAALIEWR